MDNIFHTEFELMNAINPWLKGNLRRAKRKNNLLLKRLKKIIKAIKEKRLKKNIDEKFFVLSNKVKEELSEKINNFITLKNTLNHLDELDYKISPLNLAKIKMMKDKFFIYEDIYQKWKDILWLMEIIEEWIKKYDN